MRSGLYLAILVGVSGCYQPSLGASCRVSCGAGTSCPDGLMCGNDGFCNDGVQCTDAQGTPVSVSCVMLPATCGPMGNRSCCDSPIVEGGMFFLSYDGDMFSDMSRPATLSAFRLDTYEVTVGRFRQFVAAGMGTQQAPPEPDAGARTLNQMTNQGGWVPTWNASLRANVTELLAMVKCDATYETWTDASSVNENLPMNCITWFEAMAFCVWDGGFLPTEAESMYAASGGSLQRAYPWSDPANSVDIDCTKTNYDACVPAGADNVGSGSTSPAGDGRWGQADLGGNVKEWALDENAMLLTPCNDCANLPTGINDSVVRGGGFGLTAPFVRAARRGFSGSSTRNFAVGVRCGRAL